LSPSSRTAIGGPCRLRAAFGQRFLVRRRHQCRVIAVGVHRGGGAEFLRPVGAGGPRHAPRVTVPPGPPNRPGAQHDPPYLHPELEVLARVWDGQSSTLDPSREAAKELCRRGPPPTSSTTTAQLPGPPRRADHRLWNGLEHPDPPDRGAFRCRRQPHQGPSRLPGRPPSRTPPP